MVAAGCGVRAGPRNYPVVVADGFAYCRLPVLDRWSLAVLGASCAACGAGEPIAANADAAEPMLEQAARYPADALRSPITPYVAARLRDVAALAELDDRVFMKVGASETVNSNLLYCFAGGAHPKYQVDLDGRDALLPTIEYFRAGDAAGTTPFDRPTLAAKVGVSAIWPITGNPSPVAQEIDAIHPRFALVNYGTNDMELGTTHRSAMWPFYDNMSRLLELLLARGIVPVITGLNPRGDTAAAARWSPTYDVLTRAIAEDLQLPYVNLQRAVADLPGKGLIADGVHGNTYTIGGRSEPCVFTAAGLGFNYNVRNLLMLEALDAVHATVTEAAPAPDVGPPGWQGTGTIGDPFVIDQLPFTHSGTTSDAHSELDAYSGCAANQNESGPERVYRIELQHTTALRIAVFDRAGVDVDVHLLGDRADGASCIARDDRIIERTVPAGTYHVVVDTFANASGALAGHYVLVVAACEPGDPDC